MMDDSEALQRTLARSRRVLQILEERAAGFGSLHLPAHLQLEIEEKRKEIANLEKRLRRVEAQQEFTEHPPRTMIQDALSASQNTSSQSEKEITSWAQLPQLPFARQQPYDNTSNFSRWEDRIRRFIDSGGMFLLLIVIVVVSVIFFEPSAPPLRLYTINNMEVTVPEGSDGPAIRKAFVDHFIQAIHDEFGDFAFINSRESVTYFGFGPQKIADMPNGMIRYRASMQGYIRVQLGAGNTNTPAPTNDDIHS